MRPFQWLVEAAAAAGDSGVADGSAALAGSPRAVAVPVVVRTGCGGFATSPRGVLDVEVVMWLPVISDGCAAAGGCVVRRARVSACSI